MTRHVLDGIYYSVVHSNSASSCTPLEKFSGAHWAVWVFELHEAHIALPEPWGVSGYTEHHDLVTQPTGDLRRTRLALAGYWPDGYLSRDGTGRLYFDPRYAAQTTARDQQMRLAGLDREGLGKQKRPDQETLLQQGLLEYVFSGQAGGPPGAFRSIGKWLPSYVARIDVAVAYEEHEGGVETPAQGEGQQFTITLGPPADGVSRKPLGTLVIHPQWSRAGRRVRLLGADPPLRDDLLLAEDSGSVWNDPDLPAQSGQGNAELSYFHWSWNASEGSTLTAVERAAPLTNTAKPPARNPAARR